MSEKTTPVTPAPKKKPVAKKTEAVVDTSAELLAFIKSQSETINKLNERLNEQMTPSPVAPTTIEEVKVQDYASLSDLKNLNLPKKVTVNHYIDEGDENMGLRDLNLALMDGDGGRGGFKESFGYVTKAGVKYYLTGFEEPSLNIIKIKNPEERQALLKEMDNVRTTLEKILGVDLSNRNASFWKGMNLSVRTPVRSLNMDDPKDVLVYFGILGGAISSVAPSLEAAADSNVNYKHYLHIDSKIEKAKIGISRTRNKAIAMLEELYTNGESDKLFMMSKIVLPITKGFTKKDPIDRLYNDLNSFILGENVPGPKTETPLAFISAANMELAELTKRAVVKDAIYYNLLKKDDNKTYFNTETFALVGKNMAEVVAHYLNEANDDDYINIHHRVNKYWEGS